MEHKNDATEQQLAVMEHKNDAIEQQLAVMEHTNDAIEQQLAVSKGKRTPECDEVKPSAINEILPANSEARVTAAKVAEGLAEQKLEAVHPSSCQRVQPCSSP